MTDPMSHSTLVKAISLEQDARNRNLVRADDTRSQPILIARRRALTNPARRLRLPSLPLPRRLAHLGSR
jgi:hypothetical protein